MIPWILLILLIVVYSITLPKLLTRAGLSPTLGYIPIVNFLPFLKMIKRPWWWLLLIVLGMLVFEVVMTRRLVQGGHVLLDPVAT